MHGSVLVLVLGGVSGQDWLAIVHAISRSAERHVCLRCVSARGLCGVALVVAKTRVLVM